MNTLKDRIMALGSINPNLTTVGGAKNYMAPIMQPLSRIQIYPGVPGVILYEDLQPLISADGAPIAATGPGTWGQLYAAGNRRGRR